MGRLTFTITMNIVSWLLLFLNYLVIATIITPKENVLTTIITQEVIDPVLATPITENKKDPGTERLIPKVPISSINGNEGKKVLPRMKAIKKMRKSLWEE